jgi:hypothetical protein
LAPVAGERRFDVMSGPEEDDTTPEELAEWERRDEFRELVHRAGRKQKTRAARLLLSLWRGDVENFHRFGPWKSPHRNTELTYLDALGYSRSEIGPDHDLVMALLALCTELATVARGGAGLVYVERVLSRAAGEPGSGPSPLEPISPEPGAEFLG